VSFYLTGIPNFIGLASALLAYQKFHIAIGHIRNPSQVLIDRQQDLMLDISQNHWNSF